MRHLILLGDTHIGSTVALCKPTVELDDGGTYHASRPQRELYKAWHKLANEIAKQPAKPIAILNGDLVETDTRHRSYQVFTRNRTTLRRLTADVLDDVVSQCDKAYVVRGTEAHTGKSASMDDAVGEDFDCEGHTAGSHSWWYLPLMVERVRLDIAHHAPMSGIPWNKNASAISIAAKIRFTCMERGDPAPDIVVRSHQHRWADSHDAFKTRVFQLPGWTFGTAHTERINPGAVAEIGALFITIDGADYEIRKFKVETGGRIWVKA